LKEYIATDIQLHVLIEPLIPAELRTVSVLEMKVLLAETIL